MTFEIEFSEDVTREIWAKARKKRMAPEAWLTMTILRALDDTQRMVPDAEFQASVDYIMEKNKEVYEALARSEREDDERWARGESLIPRLREEIVRDYGIRIP
jgi:hypothetical protein